MATTSESRVQSKKKVKNVKSYNKSNIPAVFIMPQSLPSDFIDGKVNGQEIKRAVETALHLDEDYTEIECVQRCNGVFKIFFSNIAGANDVLRSVLIPLQMSAYGSYII